MATLDKEVVIERLQNALGSAMAEVRKDPELLGRVIGTVCVELGLDPVACMYISGKLKNAFRQDSGNVS